MKRIAVLSLLVGMAGALICTAAPVKQDSVKSTTVQLKPQTTCPVQGDGINKNLFVDYQGKRIYVCCEGCLAAVKKDPEKYIKVLADKGQDVETIAVPAAAPASEKAAVKKDTASVKNIKISGDTPAKAAEAGYYTCPMHPEVHSTKPGSCPKCGMDLVYKKIEKVEMK